MLEVTKLPPRVVDYQDYREFLSDFYKHKKAINKAFSYRKFSQISGIKSSNFLMLVMQKRRNLSAKIATPVAKAMKLSRAESAYFVSMVKLEQAKDGEDHERFDREKKVAIRKILTKILPAEKHRYLSSWYYPLVRELAFLPGFRPEPEWVSKKLQKMITPEQAAGAIKLMIDLGLWKLKGNKIEVHDLVLDTGDDSPTFSAEIVLPIHNETLLAWTKILGSIPPAERELGLINIPINSEKIPELKKRILRFQDELIGWLQDEKNPTQVVQVGTYLVPVTTKSY
jgi:uncharacterized protein (TIGR02147 family)